MRKVQIFYYTIMSTNSYYSKHIHEIDLSIIRLFRVDTQKGNSLPSKLKICESFELRASPFSSQ